MSRLTRIALLLLVAVVVALTIYTYPSVAGFTSLVMRTVVIVGALTILVLLGASLIGRKPSGFPVILFLSSVVLIATAWPQISATQDASAFDAELEAAGPGADALYRAIATSGTKTAGRVRSVYVLAATTSRDIEAVLAGIGDPETPGLGGLFDTALVTDPAALAAGRAAVPALRANAATAAAEITRILDAEVELIAPNPELPQPAGVIDTAGLPDSARLLFIDAALRRIAAEREIYLARAAIEENRLDVQDRMLAFIEARPGAYTFDATAARARFGDPAADEAYTALLAELAALDTEDARLVAQHEALMETAARELIEAAGATP